MKGIQNAVLKKELKLRFRSFKSFAALMFYLLTLLVFIGGFFLIFEMGTGQYITPETNVYLFGLLTYVQLSLILFITPGLTAGVISTEREKQTLNILLTTSQSSWSIIFGKLTSSISFLVLLIFAGIPLSSIVFLFGGVSPVEYMLSYVQMLIVLIALASVGVMISTLIRKTIVSMITTYGIMLVLTVITAFLALVSSGILSVTERSVSYITYFLMAINPLINISVFITPEIKSDISSLTGVDFPMWITHFIFYALVTIISLWIATKKIRVNMKK